MQSLAKESLAPSNNAFGRRGVSLIELVISMASAGFLLAGLGVSVSLTAQSFRPETNQQYQRSGASLSQADLLGDLKLATGFSERTATTAAFTVPDRDGDGRPESLRYAWSGVSGAPLTLSVNGAAPTTVMGDVRQFALSYQTQAVTASVLPAEQTGAKLLLIVDDSKNLKAEELSRKSLFESWNYVVSIKGVNDSLSDLLTAVSAAQVVYVSGSINGANFSASSKSMAALGVGIVNEAADLVDELGFGQTASLDSMGGFSQGIDLPAHYILATQTGSKVSPFKMFSSAYKISGAPSPDLNTLLDVGGLTSLATLDPQEYTYDGRVVAGRRVQIPWGSSSNFDPIELSEAGKEICQRALQWASGQGDGSPTEMGYHVVFPSSASANLVQNATKVSLTRIVKVRSISAYIGGVADDIRFAIYTDKNGEPDKRAVQTAMASHGSNPGWVTLPVASTVLVPGPYWLVMCFHDAGQKYSYASSYPNGTSRTKSYDAVENGYKSLWGTGSGSSTGSRSIYATYDVYDPFSDKSFTGDLSYGAMF